MWSKFMPRAHASHCCLASSCWNTAFGLEGESVYIHIIWFAAWIGFRVEPYPFGLLTMIVSLEAIFLSTFVMISQNLADGKRQVLADHQWQTVQQEEQQNEELLISNQIMELTKAIHAISTGQSDGLANQAGDEVDRARDDERRRTHTTEWRGTALCAGSGGRASWCRTPGSTCRW